MDSKLHILQHSLGVNEYGEGRQYRNHFCTGPGSNDYDNCLALVAEGLMTRNKGSEISGGDDIFCVTQKGIAHIKQHSPKPPKLTRSQQNYQDYLDADTCEKFGDWLKFKKWKPA